MAHKKAGGSTSYGRNSPGQRLGVKLFAGQKVEPGMIIVRQRGTKFYPGTNVGKGSDYTLFATTSGKLSFKTTLKRRHDGSIRRIKVISVEA